MQHLIVVFLVQDEATLLGSILCATQQRLRAETMVVVRRYLLVAKIYHVDAILGEDHEVL